MAEITAATAFIKKLPAEATPFALQAHY